MSPIRLILGTYSPVVHLVEFTPPDGSTPPSLTAVKELSIADASWLTRHPVHKDIWYACIEPNDDGGKRLSVEGRVECYRITEKGDYEKLSQVSTVDNPCHIEVIQGGKGLAIANFSGGSALLVALEADGTLVQGAPAHYVKFPQLGEQPARAHMCVDVPSRSECWISDTCGDAIWRMKIESGHEQMSWSIAGHEELVKGHGPRHFVVSPDLNHIYTLQARSCTVTHHDLTKTGDERLISHRSILPEGRKSMMEDRVGPPFTTAAAIKYHEPSQTLLATSRMIQNDPVDSIAVFKIQPDGTISPSQILRPSKGKEYRGVGIVGNSYLVAGQTDGWMSCFHWDGKEWKEHEFSTPARFTKVVDIQAM